VQQFVWQK